jgi:hypothetical protein
VGALFYSTENTRAMEENKIKRVTSINQQGTKTFTVGFDGVDVIKDQSVEFETSIHIQYGAYDKDGKLVGMFINGALAIDYFTENDDQ